MTVMAHTLEELYGWVTNTIHCVENLRDQKSKAALNMYYYLSTLEEEIADLVPECEVEGKIARRGAVRAAVDSGDRMRAAVLAASFIATGSDVALAQELQELVMAD
jgi:hypothetical protein